MVPIPCFALMLAFTQQPEPPTADLPAHYRTEAPKPSTVVARVDGTPITAGEVEPLLWEWRGPDAIQDLITYETVRKEAQQERVDVSESDVEKAIDKFLPEFKKSVPEGVSWQAELQAQGMTRSRLFLRFRTTLLLQRMAEREFAPKDLVKVSTIVFRPKDEQASSVEDSIKKADQAYKDLQGGGTWDAVLAATNPGPETVRSKGLIGWRDIQVFPKTVAGELRTLKPGQFTKPVQTENGIQIFRLELAGNDAKGKDFDEMKAAYMSGAQSQILNRLRKETKIERLYPPSNSQIDGN